MKTVIVTMCAILISFSAMASGVVLINGKQVKSQEHIHTILAEQLNFPKSYRKNLDALYDTLSTDLGNENTIKIKYLSILKSKLGADYVEALIQAISAASQDNPKVVLLLE